MDKIIIFLMAIEIMTAIPAIITFGYYGYFWKTNDYVFTWFRLDGLVGIALFIFGICCRDKIREPLKTSVRFLEVPRRKLLIC
jgi:ABC-type phosphate transport system permease subunit